MQVSYDTRTRTALVAATATITTFAKTFVPFYLIGSTAIFAGTGVLGIALIAVSWRQLRSDVSQIPDVIVALALLYGVVVVNFLYYSLPTVPITHLLGILIFHGMFLVFGFAAARALRAVMLVLVVAAAIYLFIILQHTVRFGDIMRGNHINDIFGVGDIVLFNTFHQNIGLVLGIGMLAAYGLASNRITRTLTSVAVPILLIFLFHIAARTALIGLVSSFLLLAFGACWVRSKKVAILAIVAAIALTTIAAGTFYRYGMQDRDVDPVAPDPISRTIRELQDSDPEFRMQIWSRTLHHIVNQPDRLPFGRGVGMFPVDDGFGAPDWPLHAVEGSKHYPHNTYLEMLYETGIVGLLPFAFLTLLPLAASLRRWQSLSHVEKSALSIYVFDFVNAQFSGAFGRSNMEQFFLALAIGVIAMKRAAETRTSSLSAPVGYQDP